MSSTFAPAGAFLGSLQVSAAAVSPATFSEKCIPDFDLLLTRVPAILEAPIENFLVCSAFECALRQLVVIDPEETRATRVENIGRIDSDEVIRWQFACRVQPDLIEHAREID